MKERPILFSAPMVRAILAGTKTQTRRVVKPAPQMVADRTIQPWNGDAAALLNLLKKTGKPCPYGQLGDRLWVRETWMDLQGTGVQHFDRRGKIRRYAYGADTPPGSYGDETRKDYGLKWRPSIHMPRAASRITLEITGVRVERLQAISFADALAEGIVQRKDGGFGLPAGEHYHCADPRQSYFSLWEAINGPGSVQENPWVWAVDFKHVGAP